MLSARGWVRAAARLTAIVLVVAAVSWWHPMAASAAGLPGTFVPLPPARVLDTRTNTGAPGPVAPGSTIHVQIAGRGSVPSTGVSAVVLNVTETASLRAGYLTVYPDDAARPTASNLNFPAGDTRANLVTVKLGGNGKVAIAASSSGTLQVVADVSGYFLAGTPSASGTFVSLDPTRVLDTRTGNGATGPVAPNSTIHVQIAGREGVPASGVSAVVLNVTETDSLRAGYLTVYPDGTTRPTASNLNFPSGDTRANLVTVKLGANGALAFATTDNATVQVVADIAGYYLAGTPTAAGTFVALDPARVLDTRTGNGATGPVAANSTVHLQLSGRGAIPSSGVAGVVLNLTETAAQLGGYLTAFPSGTSRPTASNLNYPAGDTRANLATVKLGADGAISLASSNNSTVQLVADAAGYYLTGIDAITCSDPMSLVFDTSLTPNQNHVEFSLEGAGPVTVRWGGDGSPTPAPSGTGSVQTYAASPGTVGYTYSTAGRYTVAICGSVSHFSSLKQWSLTTVESFGDLGTTDYTNAFSGANMLTSVPTVLPPIATDLSGMLAGTTSFNQDISGWDTSHVTDMSHMFDDAAAFDQPIGRWDTSGVTDMSGMFKSTTFNHDLSTWDTSHVTTMNSMFMWSAFNQPIGGWDTSGVTDMSRMFEGASAFDQPIGGWNTGAVTTMDAMFAEEDVFNQPIGTWDTSKVTSMTWMFASTRDFQQDIDAWDTGRVTDMTRMFYNSAFNQPIGDWNTSNVVLMENMFDSTSFNQPIGDWNTGNVKGMDWMFHNAWAFNQPIGSWNTSKVQGMGWMFSGAKSFNQPIGAWDTGKVQSMNSMFEFASAFNQPVGSWNTGSVVDMADTFDWATSFDQDLGGWNVGQVKYMIRFLYRPLSTPNYDSLLIGWAKQSVQPGVFFVAGQSKYSPAAAEARATLVAKGWSVYDGGPA